MGQALNFTNKQGASDEDLSRLDAVLNRYYTFYKNEIEPGLGRIEHVLSLLDNPQEKLAPVVHIAGTNGKGSTLAFLQAIMEGAGQRIVKMSSPHLISFHERLYLGDGFISTLDLVELLEGMEPLYQQNEVSFFEAVTAATLKTFSETAADYTLLETGMGGRFDATNVVEKPAITLISTISHDHENFLGREIEKIAWEKAGIMRAGVPCIVGPQIFPEVYEVLRREAEKLSVPLYCAGHDWFIDHDQNGHTCLFLEARQGWPIEPAVHVLPALPLLGHHQSGNAGMALIAAKILLAQKKQEFVSIDDLLPSLQNTKWPARMQRLNTHPLRMHVGAHDMLWLDGAHNDSGAMALAAQIRQWREQGDVAVYMISGMIETKDTAAFFKPLLPLVDGIATVSVPTDWRSITPEDLLNQAKQNGASNGQAIGAYDTVEAALVAARAYHKGISDKPAHYVICGSLYLAGSVLGEDEHAKNYFG